MTLLFTTWFLLVTPQAAPLEYVEGNGYVDVAEGGSPILRYSHDATVVPEGTAPELARGDYVSLLYCLDGELLTDDYPKDHPHHRGVNWSWATVKWNGEERDLFAVRGIWARPVGKPRVTCTAEAAQVSAESLWKWDDKTPVVAETVNITVFPRNDSGRAVDFELTLSACVDGLEFCGRLEAGYSGFTVRMAPAPGQILVFHTDPADSQPVRAWADYSAEFPGGQGRSGLAILQYAGNASFPHEWRKYDELNFFQPIYPGGTLIPMTKDTPVRLRYRIWIHPGGADEKILRDQWDLYNRELEK